MTSIYKTNFNANRISWIDNAKMFAMFCVVFGHISDLFPKNILGFHQINAWIVSFNMAIFIFLSGYTSYHGLDKIVDIKDYLKYIYKIGKRLLIPTLTFSLLALILSKSTSHALGEAWFLKMLFRLLLISSSIILIINSFSIKDKYKIIFSVLFLLVSLSGVLGNNTTEWGLYFIGGYLFKRYCILDTIFKRKKIVILTLIISFILGLYGESLWCDKYNFYLYSWKDLYKNNIIGYFFERQFLAFMWIFFFILFIKIISKTYTKFSYYGTKTLGIYLVHGCIFGCFLKNNIYIDFSESGWIMWIIFISAILLTLSSLLIIKILEYNKWTKLFFLGETK